MDKLAAYSEDKIDELRNNEGIIRNRLKIRSAVTNARAVQEIQEEYGSLDSYIWEYVDHETIQNSWKTMNDIPASTPESEKMGKDLKKRGFKFVGPTICYGFMQAVGMVNDHIMDCFRHNEINNMTKYLHDKVREK